MKMITYPRRVTLREQTPPEFGVGSREGTFLSTSLLSLKPWRKRAKCQ